MVMTETATTEHDATECTDWACTVCDDSDLTTCGGCGRTAKATDLSAEHCSFRRVCDRCAADHGLMCRVCA